LALACLTKLTILTKHERILISYKFFHIKDESVDLKAISAYFDFVNTKYSQLTESAHII